MKGKTMNVMDELVPVLKRLRLSGVLQSLELRSKQAADDKLSFGEFLYRVLSDEVERRESKQLQMRLRRAAFEQHKTLEEFNFLFNPQIPKEKVIELATCQFVRSHHNIALIGPSGVGKSHIAQAIGQRACLAGFDVTLNQWETLTRFVDDVRLPLDNNAAERALRPIALGRKNFLFVGNDEAGQNLAILQSLVSTCQLHGVNPQEYIADVLIRIQTHPSSRIDELLPMNWKPQV